MGLTREQILSTNDRPTVAVDVPEWGGTVYVRTMSGSDRAQFETLCAGQPLATGKIMEKLVTFTVCDENGERIFNDDDVEELSKKNAGVILRIFQKAAELNALRETDVENIKGN